MFSYHDNIRGIGFSYRDDLITPKSSSNSLVLITFAFGEITSSKLSMITKPFGYENYETM